MSLARRLANRAKDILFVPGMEGIWRRQLHGRVMALVYHRVADPALFPFLERGGTPVIRPEQLGREISFLKEQGAQFYTFADLRAGRFPGADEFGVVLTFDDGFRDNYTTGLEVLESSGVKAVFFQASGMVGAQALIPEHALYWYADNPATSRRLGQLAGEAGWPGAEGAVEHELIGLVGRWLREVQADSLVMVVARMREHEQDEERELAAALYPTEEDLLRAARAGHEIGSHGDAHLPRSVLDAETFEQELVRSRERVAEITGTPPVSFSYPFNDYWPGDREICARHFEQVATVDGLLIGRESDPLALPRFSWPGAARNGLRFRRWLLTGKI